jgi:hypothetical protein
MITFDQILNEIKQVFNQHLSLIAQLGEIIINRDLNGRVRLIVSEQHEKKDLTQLEADLKTALTPHDSASSFILYEEDIQSIKQFSPVFMLDDDQFNQVSVVDRLASENQWAKIVQPEDNQAKRIVFFSIKGGVGRSTALVVTAWSLAEQGKKVLVLDLDLESPGLSSNLLPEYRRPTYGIADWLVEDLVDNSDVILNDMVATSLLSRNGEIFVVPAHGREFGEYIAKLGRVWMPKISADGHRESWSDRLERLINNLEQRYQPDVILIDSRAGIDEIASACVTHLKANLILLFSLAGAQTWMGYSILFDYWLRMGSIREIRERLQIVASMIPETDGQEYVADLRENAHDMFTNYAYDELQPDSEDDFNFDEEDQTAPHYPWFIRWHRSFHGLASLHGDLEVVDPEVVQLVLGDLINHLLPVAGVNNHD